MNDDIWYAVHDDLSYGGSIRLIKAASPEAAVEASGYGGTEVAVYVADYIGRFSVHTRPVVTRLSTGRIPGTLAPSGKAKVESPDAAPQPEPPTGRYG